MISPLVSKRTVLYSLATLAVSLGAASSLRAQSGIGVPAPNPFLPASAENFAFDQMTSNFIPGRITRGRLAENDPTGMGRINFLGGVQPTLQALNPLEPGNADDRALMAGMPRGRGLYPGRDVSKGLPLDQVYSNMTNGMAGRVLDSIPPFQRDLERNRSNFDSAAAINRRLRTLDNFQDSGVLQAGTIDRIETQRGWYSDFISRNPVAEERGHVANLDLRRDQLHDRSLQVQGQGSRFGSPFRRDGFSLGAMTPRGPSPVQTGGFRTATGTAQNQGFGGGSFQPQVESGFPGEDSGAGGGAF